MFKNVGFYQPRCYTALERRVPSHLGGLEIIDVDVDVDVDVAE